MHTTHRTPSSLAAIRRDVKNYLIVLHALVLMLLSPTVFGQTAVNPIDKPRFFVWQQYQDLLERGPEHSGLFAWIDYIEQCASSDAACIQQHRITTARGFLESAEFRDIILCQQGGVCALRDNPPNTEPYNREYVRQLYLVYLHREPDQGGFNAWLDYINTHPGDYDTLVHGFIYSSEYRQRFVIQDESIEEVALDWQWDEAAQVWFTYPPLESPDSRIVDAWCDPTMCYYEEEYPSSESLAEQKDEQISPSWHFGWSRRRKKALPGGPRGFDMYPLPDGSDKLLNGSTR